MGKLSLVVGDPGLSKSTLTACIASHVTTGADWPNGRPCPAGEVLMVNAEDDPADTTRPRLDAAAAIVEKVHFLDGVADCIDGPTKFFNLGHVDVQVQKIIEPQRTTVSTGCAQCCRMKTRRPPK